MDYASTRLDAFSLIALIPQVIRQIRETGKNDLIVKFLKGARRQNPPCPQTMPSWDLSIVLRDPLKGPPSESLISADMRPLSLKMDLLLALASVKQVGDLQVL